MSDKADLTSLSLLLRVQRHEPQAWDRFLLVYTPLVNHWCVVNGRLSADDAADVVQDVFMSVSRTIETFRRNRPGDSLRGWLRVITQNKIRDHVNRRNRQPRPRGGSTANLRLEQVPDQPGPVDDETEQGILMRRAVELLREHFEPQTHRAFWMSAVDGKHTDDIAGVLNMTPQAVRQACYRVRRRLRIELGDFLS